jgi:hypothetical protein
MASGVAATVARIAAAAGADVQLVGKVGEGPAGDAVLLSLAQSHVGHVAVLRDASTATPVARISPEPEALLGDDGRLSNDADGEPAQPNDGPDALTLDGGDLQLALRYLPDYRVVVVADALDDLALRTVGAAARWAGAQLIVVVVAASKAAAIPDEATVLEAPAVDPDGAFAAVVGAYAAALDRGAPPAEAFASASAGSGWSAVVD